MWCEGTIVESGVKCEYWVKHYEEKSEDFGLNGGRISKLSVRIGDSLTANYDRGWDVYPEDEISKKVVAQLIARYN